MSLVEDTKFSVPAWMQTGGIEHVPAHSSKVCAVISHISIKLFLQRFTMCKLRLPYLQVKNVTSHSDFPQSIFELNFKHEHVKWLDKLKSYVWLANNSSTNDLNRYSTKTVFPMIVTILVVGVMYDKSK